MWKTDWPSPPHWLSDVLPRKMEKLFEDELRDLIAVDDHSAEGMRKWILDLSRLVGLPPSILAREAGLAPSTLNRFLKSETNASLNANTVQKLKDTIISMCSRGAVSEEVLARIYFDSDKRRYRPERHKNQHCQHIYDYMDHIYGTPVGPTCPFPRSIILKEAIISKCILENGLFETRLEWAERPSREINIPSVRSDFFSINFAWLLEGGAGLPNYAAGTIIIGDSLFLDPVPPLPMDLVVAYRRRDDGAVACELWRYQTDPAGQAWLMPLDATARKPGLFLGESLHANRDIYVGHRVIGHMNWY